MITHDACVDPDAIPTDDGADDEAPDDGRPGGELRGRVATEVALGRGLTGTEISFDPPDARSTRILSWVDSGSWSAVGQAMTTEEITTAARSAVAHPDLDGVVLPGFTLFDRWDAPAQDSTPEVQIVLRASDEVIVSYSLEAPGRGNGRGAGDYPTAAELPGQPLPVVRFTSHDGGWWAGKYAGFWPGADVIGYLFIQEPVDEPSDDVVGDLFSSLRPASTEEWRTFLASAPSYDAELDDAPTLDDVGS